jgi:hypothetical protein
MAAARLAKLDLPRFGMPETPPEIPAQIHSARIEKLRERAAVRGYERVVVRADRAHSAGLAYLTGFDPRFEEAVLIVGPADEIVGPADEPSILVGNECEGMAAQAPLKMRPVPFQDLSLPGQPRDRSATLT